MGTLDYAHMPISASWREALDQAFMCDSFKNLCQFLLSEVAAGKVIYPPSDHVFEALNLTEPEDVKVIILGQDPYHGAEQAHGLGFSVMPGVRVPPSLRNIYKELQQDIGIQAPTHGCLNRWANQGVLLLNSVLTVQAGMAGSHHNKGWETFTDQVVAYLNKEFSNLLFILWGSAAQRKGAIVDTQRHRVLTSPHPSPLSASRGFFGNHHFSETNNYLLKHGKSPIDWQLESTL